MKRNLLSISLLIAIAFTACAQQKKATTKGTTNTGSTQTTTEAKEAVPESAGKITTLKMTRGACFGKCPSYTIELHADGSAIYTSQMFTQYEGTFEKNVGAAKVQALFKEFEAKRTDTCGTYKSMIPDLPPLHYNIQFEKKQVEIRNATFGPKYLAELSKKVDDLTKVDGTWKKTAEAQKQN
ncbi:MAG: hypothetical protein EOP51_08385 [Sphingobacteriales bacterium]|nr:MAG: hypothetical protein EOP51_08385 [Sphingobacteriales bacterium]